MLRRKPIANAALAELLARDRELEDPPFGGWAGELATPAPVIVAAPLVRPRIPPPDWDAEAAEQRRRAALQTVREPDPALHREDHEPRPASPARRDGGAAA